MIIISLILAYLMVGCTVATALYILSEDYDPVSNIDNIGIIGILWPISVPIFIGLTIIAIVSALVNIIAGFFTKNKKH